MPEKTVVDVSREKVIWHTVMVLCQKNYRGATCGQSGEKGGLTMLAATWLHQMLLPPLFVCRFKGLPGYILTRLRYKSVNEIHVYTNLTLICCKFIIITDEKSHNNHARLRTKFISINTGLLNWLNKYYKCHSLTIHLKIVQLPCILHLDTTCGLWNAFSGRYN